MIIDFHIHTLSTEKDDGFEFSKNILKNYILKNSIDCISITNHNTFNKNQFLEIQSFLKENCVMFPGIEIDFEEGHLLVISDNDNIDLFDSICQKIKTRYEINKNSFNFEELSSLFGSFNEYLIIPHYKKSKKNLSYSSIEKFGKNIFCGEVKSPKSFLMTIKDEKALVPVLFSDFRPGSLDSKNKTRISTTYTYLDCKEADFKNISICLHDRDKVSITKNKEDSKFEIFNNSVTASTGLNVIVGKRSTGKTFLLDRINDSYFKNANVKYLEQFKIVSESEEDAFENKMSFIAEKNKEQYEKELAFVFSDFLNNNIYKTSDSIETYLSSLKQFADNTKYNNEFSKCYIFTDPTNLRDDSKELNVIITSICELEKSIKYRELIKNYIDFSQLKALKIVLFKILKDEILNKKLCDEAENISSFIKKQLNKKSSIKYPDDIDFKKLFKDYYTTEKFNIVTSAMIKNNEIVEETVFDKFKIITSIDAVNDWRTFKLIAKCDHNKNDFGDFDKVINMDNCAEKIAYFQKHASLLGISESQLYKTLFKYKTRACNSANADLSGGEKAEFNLLSSLKDAENYDFLLIDEPESSFDNVFLNEFVIKAITDISKNTTVFISTHNNSLGVLLKPDTLIYSQRIKNEDNSYSYKLYYGNYLDKYLFCKDGSKVNTSDIYITTMEGGEDPMDQRRKIYDALKSR